MDDVELVQVLNPRNDLLVELAGFFVGELGVLDDVVEELPAAGVLHDQVELLGGFNDLVELDYVRMPDQL
jgi:hypothetical protein